MHGNAHQTFNDQEVEVMVNTNIEEEKGSSGVSKNVVVQVQ